MNVIGQFIDTLQSCPADPLPSISFCFILLASLFKPVPFLMISICELNMNYENLVNVKLKRKYY